MGVCNSGGRAEDLQQKMSALSLVAAAVWLALLLNSSPAHGASYFGDSYCVLKPFQDMSTFEVSLTMKTSRRSGLLLLAAGTDDYLFLELQNGNVQARMNLGAGEVTLSSSSGVQLNNLLDHKVSLTLTEDTLTMTIDDSFSTYVPVADDGEELNIDVGVWLGGTGNLEASYLRNAITPFRGCMTDVKFESHQFDILSNAFKECHDTKESCSSEFEAVDGETTSFSTPQSFISFPTWSKATGGARTLEFLMKTTIEDALLVFHPGLNNDFIAVGVMGGFLKGLIDFGNGMEVLENTRVQVEDDQWHRVKIEIKENSFEVHVDSQVASLPLDSSQKLDLVGNLYLGGIQEKMKEVFRESGSLSRAEEEMTVESFIGCLGEVKVNNKDRNLQDAIVTKDIHVKCEGEDYDYSNYYDDTATTAPPVIIAYDQIDTSEQHCFPNEDTPEIFRNVTKLLDVSQLLVPEGGEVLIALQNLLPTFDLGAAGLKKSQIIVTLKNDPFYGLVDINTNNKRFLKFTLQDLVDKHIKYMHDGNERHPDQIQIEVVAQGIDNLPECLKSPQSYILPVEIIPVNDIPQLGGGEITITERGRTRLSPSLIKIVDTDTRCNGLLVTVTSEPPLEVGYLENDKQPGNPITEFTCRDLKDGNIYFVHRGGESAFDMTLEVSDGQSESHSTTFNLVATKPHMTIVTNTGLYLTQGGNATIGIQNLALLSNPRNGDILFNVTQPLLYGELQVTTEYGVYEPVSSFRQSDLEQERVKYFSTDSNDQEDDVMEIIEFNAHLGHYSLWNNTFMVKISPAQVKVAKIAPLDVFGGEMKIIKQTQLNAEVIGQNANPEMLKYVLVTPPMLGVLQLLDVQLGEGDVFTQQDILDNTLSYKVRVQRALDTVDSFQFRVASQDQFSPLYTYPINIIATADAPVLTNEMLTVLQGGEETLNKEHLWVQGSEMGDFVYQITQGPKYGRIIRDSPPGMPKFEGAIRIFSNEDLELDRLLYKHDGSTTTSDEFQFSAYNQEAQASYDHETIKGIFKITIQTKNEHAPIRVADKVLNVVRQGQRLLTTDVIQFKDEDSGFNDSQIVYAREGILSGNIVSSINPTQPLFRFTQADLRDKKVLFIHHGADQERFSLQVSDGFHKTTALLQIQAGDPYLRIVNNTMIVIDHGATKTLNTTLLSAETNLDITDDSEITFRIITAPEDGRIIVSGIEASEFTQEDLKKGVVSYEHNYESLKSKDSFTFDVQAEERSEEGTFKIKIFKQGYRSEPEVINNEVIISYEGEHTVINQDHLKVEQADILPTEMVFTVKTRPRLGHVVKMSNGSDAESPQLDYIQSFTQDEIDQGRILYVSAYIQGEDVFSVDVSNGFTAVDELQVFVNIVPRLIPVQTLNLTVKEGHSRIIDGAVVNISHPFYALANLDFVVEEPPQHGELRSIDGDEVPYFTWSELKKGQVYYVHDSSENFEDSFTLSASAYEIERRSLPFTVAVTVIPVNDEPPRLTRNTGLEVLAGEEADITASMLQTLDDDTPAVQLVYHVEAPTSGMVALKEAPEVQVLNFTQAQVDAAEVVFIHEGEESGGFGFTVTDGEHTSPLHQFVVTARPLTITMVTQEELMVFPGTRQLITSSNLGAETSDDGNEIGFSLIRPPRLGRLIIARGENRFDEITRFSQTQLESGAVFYEHQLPEEPFWVTKDSVELILSSQPAPDVRHILPITISYYAAHSNISSQLWKNKGLDIVQGQRKAIDESILDASNLLASLPESTRADADVVYEIRRFPSRGRLTLGGQDLPRDSPYFMQEDVNNGAVEYLHDDSGAASDSFAFRARLRTSSQGSATPAESVILEEVFNIPIRRRGSDPPELVTSDMLLEVLQDSMTILSQKHLNTQDEDSPPDEVHFKVTKAPRNGRLLDLLRMDVASDFTQDMVNRGQIGFQSDGSLQEGFFEFYVTDGEHKTESYTLHIGVLAHTLVLSKAPEIKVKQGDDETLITEEMLKATTGGPLKEDVLYKITNVPKYAAVMVDRQPTSAFTQDQIRQGRVSVRFVKSTSPRDSVAFVARSRAANVSSVLNITVQPLANIAANPMLPQGAKVRVDRKLLDATPLANKTRTSPTFTVIQQPKGARFVIADGPSAGLTVDSFSQKELDDGRVSMEIKPPRPGSKSGVHQDEARFLLKAHGVPPAECVLSFQTSPYNGSGVYPVTLLRVPSGFELPVGTQGIPRMGDWPTTTPTGTHRKPVLSRRSNVWSILIPILVVLLLLLLAAILAYYVIRKNKTGKHNVQSASSKPKNGEVAGTETFRKTDAANNIPMTTVGGKDADPELLQHCRTSSPGKNQYWV